MPMLIRREREKLINAVIFFANNTSKCGKVKLFKLLYFLDFEHYKETGRSVTGLDYYAWKMGPVPIGLHEEIDAPEPDIAEAISFSMIAIRGGQNMLKISARKPFDTKHFSRRELKLMEGLAKEYKNSSAGDMIEETHLENLPWDQVYNKQGGKQERIPYDLAFRKQEIDLMQEVSGEHKEVMESLS